MHGLEAGDGLAVGARAVQEVHFDARLRGRTPTARAASGKWLRRRTRARIDRTSTIRRRPRAPGSPREHSGVGPMICGKALALGQHRAREHFRLHLLGVDFLEVDFHQQRFGVAVRIEHRGRERIIARRAAHGWSRADRRCCACRAAPTANAAGYRRGAQSTAPQQRSAAQHRPSCMTLGVSATGIGGTAAGAQRGGRLHACGRASTQRTSLSMLAVGMQLESADRPAAASRPRSARSSAGTARRSRASQTAARRRACPRRPDVRGPKRPPARERAHR